MFCMNCGREIPDVAQWCFECGTQVTARPAMAASGVGSGAAVATVPASPSISLSKYIGEEVKARSKDAWAGIKLFARSPVGGLPQSYAMFEPTRAIQVGIAFALIFEITFLIGVHMMASRTPFGIGLRVLEIPGLSSKLIIAGLIPFASLVGAGVLARKVFRGDGVFAGDVYTAGASLLPFGLTVLIAAILGAANFEIIAVLFVFAVSYNILMLYSGCSRIAGIPEAGAAPAVPIMLIVTAWLTKVIGAAILLPPGFAP